MALDLSAHAVMQRLHAGTLPESFTDQFNSDAAGFADESTAFMNDRAAAWGQPSIHPLHRSVHHLMTCIIRTTEEDSTGADNMELTPTEVKNWAETNLRSPRTEVEVGRIGAHKKNGV